MLKEQVLAPLIAAALIVGVAAVGWSMRSHRRPGPLVLTMLGSAAIAGGRLIWDVSPLVYCGGVVLVAASLWNLWLKRRRPMTLVSVDLVRKGEAIHGNPEAHG